MGLGRKLSEIKNRFKSMKLMAEGTIDEIAKRKNLSDDATVGMKEAISLVIIIYLVATMLPGAFNAFFNASTTGWDTGTIAIWGLIPLMAVIGVMMWFYRE